MEQLRVFANPRDINKYVLCNKTGRKIGSGWEGNVYLDGNCDTLKLFKNKYKILYKPNILTTADLSLESFIFPDELFICGNYIYGYRAKYFPNDLFNTGKVKNTNIDLLKLLEARKKAIEDIELLTGFNYKLNDVLGNVLFDGEKLVLIDTLSYYVCKPTLKDNVSLLDDALNYQLINIDPVIYCMNLPFEEKVERIIKKNSLR